MLKLKKIWPPYTALSPEPEAINIVRGENTLLYDEEGKTYIDAVSSWWVNAFGHNHPYINQKIKEQLDQLEHVIMAGFVHPQALNLADKLVEMGPAHPEKVFFSDNGSTAVEVALKMAIQYHHNRGDAKRKTIIAFEKAYHGDTFGAMSIGGEDVFFSAFDAYRFPVERIPIPTDENFLKVLTKFEEIVSKNETVAFIFEPLVQGAAGMRMYKAEYLDGLMAIAQQFGVICIADEVMTGFGRTGKLFATDHLQHKQDITTLSKCLTGGYLPMGITLANTKIVEAFSSSDSKHTLYHGHSYTGNPLSCAAANASIELALKPETQENWKRIQKQHETFAQKLKQLDFVKNIRIRGTIIAWELDNGDNSYLNPIKKQLMPYFLKNGVLLRPLGNTMYILPPYCISNEELEKVYEVCLNIKL